MSDDISALIFMYGVAVGVSVGLGVAFVVAANHLARKISKAAEPDEPDGEWDA